MDIMVRFTKLGIGTQPLDPSTARWPESEHRIGLPVAAIGSHFTFQFDGAKALPNLLLLHSPFLRLTIHIPSHSGGQNVFLGLL